VCTRSSRCAYSTSSSCRGPGERVQDVVGDPGDAAPLDALEVLRRDAGEEAGLSPSQAGNAAASAAVVRQAGLLRGDPGAAGLEELAELPARVLAAGHTVEVTGGALW
jgi:hypothetical protein